ncbi:MAG: flagellar hook-length control protein FliK, partial [Ruminiclostridium sp.]|nr:flagellar hook-length control protein FliK [Ruminiclostridium sp.]
QSDSLETKLTQAFGLDAGMSVTLGKILKLTESQIDEAISQALQDKNAEKGPGIKLDDLKLETVSSKDISAAGEAAFIETTELPGLVLQLRLKLKELGEKLEQNEKALMDEIRLNINPVLKNAAALLKVPVNTVETGESSVTDTGIGDCMEDDTVSSQEVNQANSKKEKNHAADSGTILLQSAAAGSETRENVQFLGGVLNGLQSKETEAIAENAGMKTPLSGKEILNQVIEKAKVVLTADKSEMVIDLKPDSLGKLSLKVGTEHGMVMAKFIAESQQVRQVLEANMQLLKESMEKQGLNVQGFSVSVRQESHGSRNDYNSYGDGGRRIPTIQVPGSGRMYIDAAEVDRLLRINPYRQEGNTINLTA